jgi:hypothetical protein
LHVQFVLHPPSEPPPHPLLGKQAAPCSHPVGVPASTATQVVAHWKCPVGSHLHWVLQLGPSATQPLPCEQVAPCPQKLGGGGGGGGHTVRHWKWPVESHVQVLVQPLGPPPLPQPEPGMHTAPGGAQVDTGGVEGGQISIMHWPLTIA